MLCINQVLYCITFLEIITFLSKHLKPLPKLYKKCYFIIYSCSISYKQL